MIDGFSFPHQSSGSNVVVFHRQEGNMINSSSLQTTPLEVSPASFSIHPTGSKRISHCSTANDETLAPSAIRAQVRFPPKLVTGEIDHRFEIEEIVTEQWYSDDELQRIRNDCQETIKMIRSNVSLPQESHCKRGLESHFRDELVCLRCPLDINSDVLDAQIDLWDTDVDDPTEPLARFYALQSAQYAVKAQITGLHDSMAIVAEETDPAHT